MLNRLDFRHELTGVAARWTIGFVGSLAVIFVLPRLIRAAVTHYAFRLVAEIVVIISFGLLAEKAAEWVARSEPNPNKSN